MQNIISAMKARRFESIILCVYFISYGLILINRGFYWDDWVWIARDSEFFSGIGRSMGFMWLEYWFSFSFSHPFLTRSLVFIFNLMTAVFFYKIICKHTGRKEALLLTLIFAVLPINNSRAILCTSQYSLCLMFFWCGFYLVAVNIHKKKLLLRLVSHLLFFLSFEMVSLLFFYLIVALYVWWQETNFKYIFRVIMKYWDYVLVAVVFLAIKTIWFSPTGLYAGYNNFNLYSAVRSPVALMTTAYDFTFGLLHQVISSSLFYPAIILFFALFYFVFSKTELTGFLPQKKMGVLSLLIIFCALFPYVVVGKIPLLEGWDNRHSMLLGCGLTFLLYSAYTGVKKLDSGSVFSKILLSLTLSSFIVFNFNYNKDMLDLSYKQEAVRLHFMESDIIRNNTTFLFEDRTRVDARALVDKNNTAFYAFNGMMFSVYGDETRFMVSNTDQYDKYALRGKELYHLRYSEWIETDLQYRVILNREKEFSFSDLIKLFVFSIGDENEFRKRLKNSYSLSYEKL